jgi:hypothetical protein
VSIYKDSSLVYRFEENTFLKPNNFGDLTKRDTIHLKNINLYKPNKALKFNYKILGDTTELHHQLQAID